MLPVFWPPVLMIILLLAFLAWLGWAFFYDLVELFINGVIIYFIGLRANAEINEGKLNLYMGSAVIGLAVIALAGNFLRGWHAWKFTTWVLLSFAVAQAAIIAHRHYTKKQKK